MVRIAPVTVSPPPSGYHPKKTKGWGRRIITFVVMGMLATCTGPRRPAEIDVPLTASASLVRTAEQDCDPAYDDGLCRISYQVEIALDQGEGFYEYECHVAALDRHGTVVFRGASGFPMAELNGGGMRVLDYLNLASIRRGYTVNDLRGRSTPALRRSIVDLRATCRATLHWDERPPSDSEYSD